jgi:VanZ family protein
LIWITAVAFGGLIEIVQPYVGRGAEWADLVADGLGAALGVSLGLFIRKILRIKS